MTYLSAALAFIRAVPLWVWLVVALVASGGLWLRHDRARHVDIGRAEVRAEWDAEKARNTAAAAGLVEKSDSVTERVVTKTVEVVREVQGRTKTIIEKVFVYVPNDACPIDGSYRLLVDAAALQTDAAPWRRPLDAPAPVAVDTAAASVVANYGACHENAARLSGWQRWYREQAALRAQ